MSYNYKQQWKKKLCTNKPLSFRPTFNFLWNQTKKSPSALNLKQLKKSWHGSQAIWRSGANSGIVARHKAFDDPTSIGEISSVCWEGGARFSFGCIENAKLEVAMFFFENPLFCMENVCCFFLVICFFSRKSIDWNSDDCKKGVLFGSISSKFGMAKGHFLYRLYDQVVGYHLAVPTPIIHPGETNLSAIPDVNIFIENRHQWASMHSFTSFQLDIHRIARSHECDFFIPSSGHNQHPKLHHLACSVSCQSRKGQRSWVGKNCPAARALQCAVQLGICQH